MRGAFRGPHQLWALSNFTGGETFLQREDREAEIMVNFELMRDGYLTNRLGTTRLNANDIGAEMIVGMDLVGQTKVLIAKSGTTFYYGDINPTITFSSFTVPKSPGSDPVRFASAGDARAYYMVNKNFTGVVKWDGASGSASVVSGSPVGEYISHYNKVMYVAGDPAHPNRLYHSDAAAYDSWPALNYIDISPRHGFITGMVNQPGQLIVFCERAILTLRGKPPLRYNLDAVHEYVGCDHPASLSSFGSVSVFRFRGNLIQLSSTVEVLSDQVRGYSPHIAGSTDVNRSWGVLTPNYYVLAQSTNPGSTRYAPSSTNPLRLFIYDRTRYQCFYRWAYPPESAVGHYVGAQAVVAAPEGHAFYIAGGDGNVYRQSLRQWSADYSYTTSSVSFTKDRDIWLDASQDGTGQGPTPTTEAAYTGILDADELVGFTITTENRSWYDRTNTGHVTSVTFKKTAPNVWAYTINGIAAAGAWDGTVPSANDTGTITFTAGVVSDVNGGGAVAFDLVIGDDTAGDQTVSVDFTALTQPSAGGTGDSTVDAADATSADGSGAISLGLTTEADWTGVLDSSAAVAATAVQSLAWWDRSGVSHRVVLTLTKTVNNAGLDDTWTYAITGFTGGVWVGLTSGASTGTLTFNAAGAQTSPVTTTLVIDDGTTGGQSIDVDLTGITSVAGGGEDVMGQWRSRRLDMGSPLIQKTYRRVLVAGQGTATLATRQYGVDGTQRLNTLFTNQSLPRDTRQPAFSGASGYPRFSEIQLELTGTDLWVKALAMEWRAIRLSGGNAPA